MAIYMWRELPPLCFTANTAGSTVALNKNGSPTTVTLETSLDGVNWSTYTFGSTITLSNIGDKVYWRNTSETTTGFSTEINSNYYRFAMTWSIAASWDITSLINKNGTDTLSWNYCYNSLFYWCTSLTTPPSLPATTLTERCYNLMFYWCTWLTSIPQFIALSYPNYACSAMFNGCSNIKISTTQTWIYQNEYRIPTTWTGTAENRAFYNMFINTWWTFTWAPTINKTYYTSNQVI